MWNEARETCTGVDDSVLEAVDTMQEFVSKMYHDW
jgi:hypothetical protein